MRREFIAYGEKAALFDSLWSGGFCGGFCGGVVGARPSDGEMAPMRYEIWFHCKKNSNSGLIMFHNIY